MLFCTNFMAIQIIYLNSKRSRIKFAFYDMILNLEIVVYNLLIIETTNFT